MKTEIYNTLYKYIDEDGNQGEDLREVQLMENFSKERINKLIDLTSNEDQYISYKAMLILISWGIDKGFQKLDEFIDNKLDMVTEFEPHRIYGEDNVYDVISDALYISTYNTENEEKILPYIHQMLKMYGNNFFESRLKHVLLKMNLTKTSIDEIKSAVKASISNKRYYQASQLLPVLAKYDKESLNKYIDEFNNLSKLDKRINYNLEEVQEYI
ncbi:hypothetical protein [Aquimarina algicola]|uniref:HEAT repeat domain-containing protein n=1 Tax=Aquimarina algicola TaxID=2589995 RepID=A0A504JMD2_9FLAO|nr:hypothetical protein [Aquimarina algicola]TPN88918.1 hypothetical protein FHK87_01500 [Aquimarina algicola]